MPRDPARRELIAGLARARKALSKTGLLLAHDARLPSFTALLANEVVSGSWWAHPKSQLIYDAFQALGDDVAFFKLVNGKQTLVERSLWPAVAGAALSGDAWQTAGLSENARRVLAALARPRRADEIELPAGSGKIGPVVSELEQRLLVSAEQLHTDSGHHVRVLTPMKVWCRQAGLAKRDMLRAEQAYATLEAAVSAWKGAKLPWQKQA